MYNCPMETSTDKVDSRVAGFSSEMLVAYRFAAQGYLVSFPLCPCGYDLLVDVGTAILRIQTKKAWWVPQRIKRAGKGDRAHWVTNLMKRDVRGMRHRTSARAFDYLCVVCDLDVYVIPTDRLISTIGELVRVVSIKPPLAVGRNDAMTAGTKYEEYKNRFLIPDPLH